MKITYFRIENFRNIRLAECTNPPDFIVVCGGNGCGKSALLQALMTAKEYAAPYGGFEIDPRSVSADATQSTIEIRLRYSEIERNWYLANFKKECPEEDTIILEMLKNGQARATKRSPFTQKLCSWYSSTGAKSPGFFDYIDAHRGLQKKQLSTWDSSSLSDNRIKDTLGMKGQTKFQYTKEYLAALVMRDLQTIQTSMRAGNPQIPDSLKPIRDFFDSFFSPMKFLNVLIDSSPFQYLIQTPKGIIDIDDLSSGEKEILNTYIRFHQLQPNNAIILFDEADAHLHPDLERRYLEVLRKIALNNQLWLTTHSPEMMIAAGAGALYTVLKEPRKDDQNQFVQVSSEDDMFDSLSELMGTRGLVSFNQKVIFIEGEDASADRAIYEKLYPPGIHNISFIPAGNSATVRKTAERVNSLLAAAKGFQNYYAIVDGDIERALTPPDTATLFQLPIYHVENILLDEKLMLDATRALLGFQCPYANEEDITKDLLALIVSPSHLAPYSRAILDARIAMYAKQLHDSAFTNQSTTLPPKQIIEFSKIKKMAETELRKHIEQGTWKLRCKGRDLIKAYCSKNGMSYTSFRNVLVDKLQSPPSYLTDIMNSILTS